MLQEEMGSLSLDVMIGPVATWWINGWIWWPFMSNLWNSVILRINTAISIKTIGKKTYYQYTDLLYTRGDVPGPPDQTLVMVVFLSGSLRDGVGVLPRVPGWAFPCHRPPGFVGCLWAQELQNRPCTWLDTCSQIKSGSTDCLLFIFLNLL